MTKPAVYRGGVVVGQSGGAGTLKRMAASVLLCACLVLCGCSPKKIQVIVEAPSMVAKGSSFDIRVRVRNTAAVEQTVIHIDIGDGYLKGVAVEKAEPPYKEGQGGFGTMTYSYDLKIPAGGETVFTFHARALKSGDYSGDLDVVINRLTSLSTHPLRLVVE
jgi:hypothetical protein